MNCTKYLKLIHSKLDENGLRFTDLHKYCYYYDQTVENILFIIELNNLNDEKDYINRIQLAVILGKIKDYFLTPCSKFELNISDSKRKRVESKITSYLKCVDRDSKFDFNCFNMVCSDIHKLIDGNSIQNFITASQDASFLSELQTRSLPYKDVNEHIENMLKSPDHKKINVALTNSSSALLSNSFSLFDSLEIIEKPLNSDKSK
eukprot:GAHX01001615.1.p1 GENE.GAHX01001615.1~~GAHX01001615.1.p1  ORF type:complete len:205 (-),score=39.72 GAHX01001615.1:216-830(-)